MPEKKEHKSESSNKETDIHEPLSDLANSCFKRGLYKQAMQLFQQTLEAHQRLWDEEHPDTLTEMNKLAESLMKLCWYQKAMHLHKQILELRRRILGGEHYDTIQRYISQL